MVYSVTFGYLPFGIDDNSPYQTIQEQGASRQITLPNTRYTFAKSPEQIDHGVAVTHAGVTIQVTQHQIADLTAFRNAALALLDTPVNNAPVTFAGTTFPAGKLLFETYTTESTRSLFGMETHSATMTLNYSALPWNSLVRGDGVIDELNPKPYTPGPFNTLIY